jgi:hypothetical protein
MGKKNKPTQRTMILDHLLMGKSLDRMAALNLYGCIESPAVISGLRKEGYKIETRKKNVPTRFAGNVEVADWILLSKPEKGCSAEEYAAMRG